MRPIFAKSRSQCIFMATLVMLISITACQNAPEKDEQHETQATKGPAQVSFENGQTILTLDIPTQKRLGIEFATLVPTVTSVQATLPAVVLSLQDLTSFRNSYVATQAQVQKSRLEADVARKEYARLKTLFDQNQNVSEKSLQSAEGTLHANEADVRAGEQQLNLQTSVVRQEWGSVVADWSVDGSPELQRVFDQREVLVQMTIPSDATFGPPKTVPLEIPGGGQTTARLVSTFPRVDPRIQGRSFLYICPRHSDLTPNMNLVAHVSVGNPMKGLIVPTSAMVWSEGKAWVYLEISPEHFARRAVSIDNPVNTGFFVAEGFSAGDKVVTKGAQTLLSEEMLPRGQGGGEQDEN
jgi:membrane fusion protein, multidrug efflux system